MSHLDSWRLSPFRDSWHLLSASPLQGAFWYECLLDSVYLHLVRWIMLNDVLAGTKTRTCMPMRRLETCRMLRWQWVDHLVTSCQYPAATESTQINSFKALAMWPRNESGCMRSRYLEKELWTCLNCGWVVKQQRLTVTWAWSRWTGWYRDIDW